jgi:hypothetical protein
MNNIDFKILRYADHLYCNEPAKIIGFNVIKQDDPSMSVYHEVVLTSSISGSQFVGKSTEECVDTAFYLLSSSLAKSANELLNTPSIIGSFYIPN